MEILIKISDSLKCYTLLCLVGLFYNLTKSDLWSNYLQAIDFYGMVIKMIVSFRKLILY